MRIHARRFLLTIAAMLAAGPAAAGLLENFDTDTADVFASYPGFSLSGAATGVVLGQQLRLVENNHNASFSGVVTAGTYLFGTDASIAVRAGAASGSPGAFNVALFLGTGTPSSMNANDNRIVFHPGYGGGALRIEGAGGFGNTDVGFTPGMGTGNLHTLEVTFLGGDLFGVTLTDGSNPALTYSTTWHNAGLAAASYRVGLATVDVGGGAVAVFDELRIGTVANTEITEPASAMLLALALPALAARRRRAPG